MNVIRFAKLVGVSKSAESRVVDGRFFANEITSGGWSPYWVADGIKLMKAPISTHDFCSLTWIQT